ncbi:MAG: glycosyltransferase family 4 protein [Anaerolineae bacterium]
MKILIISSFYPPYEVGGWEQNSQELARLFEQHGHEVLVLTSNHGVTAAMPMQADVQRTLTLESNLTYYRPFDFLTRWRRNVECNQALVRQAVEGWGPDIIFVHSMWNLTSAIPLVAEQLRPSRVVYEMFGNWPHAPSVHEQYWSSHAARGYRDLPKRMVGLIAHRMLKTAPSPRQLQFQHVLAVSEAIRQELITQAHIPADNIQVIYNGIDPAPFLAHSRLARPISNEQPLKVFYGGGLFEHKGVHTLIAAFAELLRRYPERELSLTILGSGHPGYTERLHHLVVKEGIGARVTFQPKVPREEMARILGEQDIFVLPSIYEPLARMLQEGMAAGLAVIGTEAWGTREALVDGVNGLAFPPEDVAKLAAQLDRFVSDAGLRRQMGAAAQQTVLAKFTLERMYTETEAYLRKVTED